MLIGPSNIENKGCLRLTHQNNLTVYRSESWQDVFKWLEAWTIDAETSFGVGKMGWSI